MQGIKTIQLSCLILFVLLLFISLINANLPPVAASNQQQSSQLLSSHWSNNIQQWGGEIVLLAEAYGLDPDLIAAVVKEESNGRSQAVSPAGAVGLMGVMPREAGLDWRPTAEELTYPGTNLRWGVAILADTLRQSGGDLYVALAAYTGGWERVNQRVPQAYAANVLNNYAQAIAVRNGVSPDIAARWSIAVDIRHGHVPLNAATSEPTLLGLQPSAETPLFYYGEHLLFNTVTESGQVFSITGYAVPLLDQTLIAKDVKRFGSSDRVNEQLQARLDETAVKSSPGSNHSVLMACLPRLRRLRGHTTTRWYAPTSCPEVRP